MDYTPHTDDDVRAMLDFIGASSIEDLFEPVPASLRLDRPLAVPPPMAEAEILGLMQDLARRNRPAGDLVCFAGGGAYDHYVPAPVRHLAFRSEFATSYTPYQPELSQGVLGALFEFQTMICELTGMDVSNASLYDGSSALVEAVNLAVGATGRKRVVVSEAVPPTWRAVLATFGRGQGLEIETVPAPEGAAPPAQPGALAGAACMVVAQPNFFGCVEDLSAHAAAAHETGALLVASFDPVAGGLLEAPGVLGADVVVGEGQALGNALNFGGPYLGYFATRMEHVRRVPGRIVGATVDVDGKPGFVLTLQAREQHIRREKAASNVCTNQTLMAIAATVYLSWLGPAGLRELGETCSARTSHAAELLGSAPGCSVAFDGPVFKEFVLRVPHRASDVARSLATKGYLVGPALGAWYPGLDDCLLIAVTERRSPEEIEGLAKALAEVVA